MWEKNGSRDAFRFFIHEATGGSDHIVFNNASVAVPGIEFFTWPDQWYHADTDTPDKGDPTEMRRVAFIGATSAWVSANLTDEMLPGLLDVVSDFGFNRVAERGIPKAMEILKTHASGDPEAALALAVKVIEAAVAREHDALRSIEEVHTGNAAAVRMVDEALASWAAYGQALQNFLVETASTRAGRGLELPAPEPEETRFGRMIPRLADEIRGQVFNMGQYPPAQEFFQANPGILAESGLTTAQTRSIESFIDGARSVLTIRDRVIGATGQSITAEQVARHLEVLEEIGWIEMEGSDL
jgi:hypothetical protein